MPKSNSGKLENEKTKIKAKLTDYEPYRYDDLRIDIPNKSLMVTKFGSTEKPFSSELNEETGEGIYVDITSGQPLFTSYEKYDAGCGWPSFTEPISEEILQYLQDNSLGETRTEVKAKISDSHLGHVFEDGPKDKGGKRYCINGAALKFIPKAEMKDAGYEYLIPLLEAKNK